MIDKLRIAIIFFFGTSTILNSQKIDTTAIGKQIDSILNVYEIEFNKKPTEHTLMQIENIYKRNVTYFGKYNQRSDKIIYLMGKLAKSLRKDSIARYTLSELLDIRDGLYGHFSSEVAEAYRINAAFYFSNNEMLNSLTSLQTCIDIFNKIPDTNSISLAKALTLYGVLMKQNNDLLPAKKCYLQALNIYKLNSLDTTSDYIGCLGNLGNVESKLMNYDSATFYLMLAKKMALNYLGINSELYKSIYSNLTAMLFSQGKFAETQNILEEQCLNFKPKDFEFLLNVSSVINLITLYLEYTDLNKVDSLFNILNSNVDELILMENPYFIMNKGRYYTKIQNFDFAEFYFKKGIDLCNEKFSHEVLLKKWYFNNLSVLYSNTGKINEAILTLRQNNLDIKSTKYVDTLELIKNFNNFGAQYLKLSNYNLSKIYLDSSLLLFNSCEIKDTILYINLLNNLGKVRWYFDYNDSENLFLQAYGLSKAKGSREMLLHCTSTLYNYYLNINKTTNSEKFGEKLMDLLEEDINLMLISFSEETVLNYMLKMDSYFDLLYSAIVREDISDQFKKHVCSFGAQYKNLLLNYKILLNNSVYNKSENVVNESRRIKFELAFLRSKLQSGNLNVSKIEEIENGINIRERELYNLKIDSIIGLKANEINVNNMKKDEAFLEFIKYKKYGVNMERDTDQYYGVIIYNSSIVSPIIIDLGKIDCSLSKSINVRENISLNYGDNSKSNYHYLFEKIWKPVSIYLSGVKKLYYSPIGTISELNLGAIKLSKNCYLMDSFELINQVVRNLTLIEETDFKMKNNNALILGGLNYDYSDSIKNKENWPYGIAEVSVHNTRGKSNQWMYLPGTKEEAENIHRKLLNSGFESNLWCEGMATEFNFKQQCKKEYSPIIIHIATHAFYLSESNEALHPLMKSGLILAGANSAWSSNVAITGSDNGILTSYEIAQLNLSSTELVILSACNSGIGDIKGSEGIYGLQRAFKIAGVKYIIMSLWPVPDKATNELMTLFYEFWMEDKHNIRTALTKAQKQIRIKYPDPYYWAGFELVE